MAYSGTYFVIVLICCNYKVSMPAPEDRVKSLEAYPQFNDLSHYDYYFVCNTCGTSLSWNVQGQSRGGFSRTTPVGTFRTFSNDGMALGTVAFLLSSRINNVGKTCLTSVLVVHALSNVPQPLVQCVCSSVNDSFTYTVKYQNTVDIVSSDNGSVNIEHVFSKSDMISTLENTINHFVLCKVRGETLSWEVNGVTVGEFKSDNNVGEYFSNITTSNTLATRATIFLGRQVSELTSLLILSDVSYNTVSIQCSGDAHHLLYSISDASITPTTSDALIGQNGNSAAEDSTPDSFTSGIDGSIYLEWSFLCSSILLIFFIN